MIDIIHVMKTSAPSLLPILRSDLQGEVMALLFSHPEQQYTVSQIADATRASLPTVSREVNRLNQSGLVTVQNDIDVLVVGSPSRQKLYEAIDDAEQKLGYEVNVKRLSPEAWNSQDGFVQTVRSRPMEVLFGQLEVNDVHAEA